MIHAQKYKEARGKKIKKIKTPLPLGLSGILKSPRPRPGGPRLVAFAVSFSLSLSLALASP